MATTFDVCLAASLYENGMSVEGVEKWIGINRQNIYVQFRNYGIDLRPKNTYAKTKAWLLAALRTGDRDSGCWEWPFNQQHGYGKSYYNSKQIKAHVLSLILDGKPNPGGLQALHSCDNGLCVNPSHLRWGTPLENMNDMFDRGRAHFLKLTEGQVKETRIRVSNGESRRKIAGGFGVSHNAIDKIINGKTHKTII